LLSGEILLQTKRSFAPLRYAQDDNILDLTGRGLGGSEAASKPTAAENKRAPSHQSDSEESHTFSRSPLFQNQKFYSIFEIKKQKTTE